MFIFKYLRGCMLLTTALVLTACEDKPVLDEVVFASQAKGGEDLRNSLSKVAGRGGMEVVKDQYAILPLTEVAKPYVGRYTVTIDCSDRFIRCNEGQADLVLTLLEDGTARRSIVYTGLVAFDNNLHYRKDSWSYDEIHHQIILHRDTGVEFFYNVTEENDLIMDLEKVINGTELNRKYFAEGNPVPAKAYMLKKVS